MIAGRLRFSAAVFIQELHDYPAQVFLTVAGGSVITNGMPRTTGVKLSWQL